MNNWFKQHPNWTLIAGLIIGPFLGFWFTFGLVNIIVMLVPALAQYMAPAIGGMGLIAIILPIIAVVNWYLGQKKGLQNKLGKMNRKINTHSKAYEKLALIVVGIFIVIITVSIIIMANK